MSFDDVLAQVRELLHSKGRVAYRALKRRFDLDDDYLEDLKAELIDAEQVARDEDGKILVWKDSLGSGVQSLAPEREERLSSPPTLDPRPSDARLSAAERRQLTVMFCDLVDSTKLSTQLDPEDYHTVVQRYHQTCEAVVQRYGGFVPQHLGDGLLVYFGYPVAHEDDAQRAVRAALEIVEAIQCLSFPTIQLPQPVQVRIGIHSGPVVIGEIGGSEKREMLALGETPNLAARVQGVAAPNTVAMSAATQRLAHGLFEYQELGLQELKGFAAPVMVYRVSGESVAQTRFEAEVHRGLTPLVGREEELALLHRRWEQAKEYEGQVVLLSGEPGIGKSRLMRELRERAERDRAARLEFRCSPYYQNSALHPVIEHLQRLLHWQKDETSPVRLDKLQATLARYHFPQTDTLALFAALLSLPHPADTPPLTMSPQRQKQKTEEALIAWLVEEAEQAPLYCAWEDLHWADPSTLELLGRLIDQASTTRLFMLLTSRPEFTPPWGQHGHLSQLTLSRLGRRQAPQMIAKLVGGKTLPEEVVQQIAAKTDGVPLFVEELTKMVLESGLLTETEDRYQLNGPLPPLAIPSTLQDSLMARLDRLATTKELAQLGATLGREFSYDLLHAVSPLTEPTLQQGLQQLVEAELLYQRGTPPQSHYLFKHALIQDTAYQSLLKSRRQQLHQQIAQVLEVQFPQTKETQPELLAYHYTEAGLISHAIPYWQQTGQHAVERSAYTEAIHHFTKGLDILKALPDTLERARQELTLQVALGPALLAAKGWTVPEIEQAYSRACELSQLVGDTSQLFPALWGHWAFCFMRNELPKAHTLVEALFHLAQRNPKEAPGPAVYMALGYTSYALGKITTAQEYFEQGATIYTPQHHHALAVSYGGADPGIMDLTLGASTLWMLGYPKQAQERMQAAISLGQQLSHPHSLAWALSFAAELHYLCRNPQRAQERAEATRALSIEQGFPFWLERVAITRGWALTKQGRGVEGVAQTRQGLAAYRARGAEMWRPHFLAMLAEAYETVGQIEEGLHALTEAVELAQQTGLHYFDAELYRLKGELTLQQENQKAKGKEQKSKMETDAQAEAEACFRKAIEVAQKQQAKSLELRATVSLARLWQEQGKRHAARNMLSEIYNWFTEGFDTKDLQEAKVLLDE